MIFSAVVDIFYEESGAETPIFLTVICYMSCVNEIVQYELFDAVVDGVHTPGVFHFVAMFEVFRNAFNLGVLTDKQIVGFLCVPIHTLDNRVLFRCQFFYFTKVPHTAKKVNKFLYILYKSCNFVYNS